MRIDLDRDLDAASRDDHDPSTLDAAHLLGTIARRRRRTAALWLAAALVLALVAGLVAWYRPRLGPAPAPSPTPSPAYTWDNGDPTSTPFTVEEAERRCPTPAGMVVDQGQTQRHAGGVVVFVPAATPGAAPTPPANGAEPPDDAQWCELGYHRVPDRSPVTAAELAGDPATLLRACARRSGFDVDDRWHPAPVVLSTEPVWGHPGAMVAATTDSGWMLTCYAEPGAAHIDVQPVSEWLSTRCPRVQVMPRDVDAPPAADPNGPATVRTAVVVLLAPVPDADGRRVDQSVTRMDLTVADPMGTTLTGIPVTGGFVAVGRTVVPRRHATDQEVLAIGTTVRLHTRAGQVRTCRT